MQKTKVLLVSHKYPPSVGGMQKHFYELKEGILSHQNFDISSIIITKSESPFLFLLKVRNRIKKHLKSSPDTKVVYVNDGLLACLVGDLANKRKVKFVATVHGLDIVFPNSIYQRLLTKQLKYFTKIIPVSTYTKDRLIEIGIPESKIQLILNGVDIERAPSISKDNYDLLNAKYTYLEDKKVLLSLGRGVKRKGFSWFARNVMPMLGNDVVYIMIGEMVNHETRSWYENLIPKTLREEYKLLLGFPDDSNDIKLAIDNQRIFHLGKLPNHEVQFLLARCNFFIVPNIKVKGDAEGFGLVALEGVMAGKLVIASDLEGLKSAIIPYKNGILVEASNKSKWVSTIESNLSDESINSYFLDNAVQYTIKHFSWKKMVDQYALEFISIQ